MEESSIESGFDAPAESKLPMLLGLAGIILGGISLILAMSARSGVSQLADRQNANEQKVYADVQQALADARASGGDSHAYETLATDFETFKNTVSTNFENVNVQYAKLAETVASVNGGRRVAPPQPGTSVSAPAESSGANAVATGEYTIRSGDNPWKIAQSLGCTVKEIEDLNPGLDPTRLRVGQKIKVPASR